MHCCSSCSFCLVVLSRTISSSIFSDCTFFKSCSRLCFPSLTSFSLISFSASVSADVCSLYWRLFLSFCSDSFSPSSSSYSSFRDSNFTSSPSSLFSRESCAIRFSSSLRCFVHCCFCFFNSFSAVSLADLYSDNCCLRLLTSPCASLTSRLILEYLLRTSSSSSSMLLHLRWSPSRSRSTVIFTRSIWSNLVRSAKYISRHSLTVSSSFSKLSSVFSASALSRLSRSVILAR